MGEDSALTLRLPGSHTGVCVSQQAELGQAGPVCALKSWETDSKLKPGVQAVVAGGRDSVTPALCVCLGLPGSESQSTRVGARATWHWARGLVSGHLGPWVSEELLACDLFWMCTFPIASLRH